MSASDDGIIFQTFNEMCKKQNWILLSFNNPKDHCEMQCNNNHIFKCTVGVVSKARNRGYLICEQCKYDEIILRTTMKLESQNFSLISFNIKKSTLQCNNGHTIIRGTYHLDNVICEYCKSEKIARNALATLQDILTNKNAKLLISEEDFCNRYKNHKTKFTIQCDNNHIWETYLALLVDDHWCKFCASERLNRRILAIEDAQELARRYGGKLISESFKNVMDLLEWECQEGHRFYQNYRAIDKDNIWCNKCSIRWKSEEICRIYFETIFGHKFPKYRSDWLINRVGNRLELDGCCEELGIAFEHNGHQHYGVSQWFNDDLLPQEKFIKTRDNDLDKQKLCDERNIKLIIIEQLHAKTSLKKLEKIIKQLALEYGVAIKDTYQYDFSTLSQLKQSQERLQIVKEVATSKGGECLSNEYIFASLPIMEFKCKNGHIWMSSYDRIVLGGGWCKKCQIKTLDITKEELYDLYVNQEMTVKQICNILDTKYLTLKKYFIKYDLTQFIRNKRPEFDKDELYDLYIKKRWGINEISISFGSDYRTIKNALIRFSIPIKEKKVV
jgi:hypothetical protein